MGFPSGPTPPRARSWHILAGEYPPQTGGVGDYTAQIAAGLARAGCDVHVWTTAGSAGESPRNDDEEGVVVHRAPSRWTRAGLAQLGRALEGFPQPRRLLVQYVPNVWGQKGMNIGFAHWLRQRAAAGDDVQTMFHELWYHIEQGDRLIRRLLPPVQKYMVRQILQASRRAFLSSTHWEGLLRPYLRNGGPAPCWTPVPSNVPVVHDPAGVAAIQRRILGDHAGADATIVGSFGTFQDIVAGPLLTAFPALLDASDGAQSVLLIGRGSQEFAARLRDRRPDLAGRVAATGAIDIRDASLHVQACDLMLQPFPEGVTTRRTTLMACLAHARPVVTSLGPKSDPFWKDCLAVVLTPAGDAPALAREGLALIQDPAARARLGATAVSVYEAHFSIDRAISALLDEVDAPAGKLPVRLASAVS